MIKLTLVFTYRYDLIKHIGDIKGMSKGRQRDAKGTPKGRKRDVKGTSKGR